MKGDVTFVDRRARELASDPTLNVALEASAGTGKTRVLVDRYIHLIEGGASPRHVLAITFTRKAAGEMRSRIIEELKKRPKLWKDIRTRLFEIHITTIDAFCLGLLREFPLEAGLDPDIALIDEVDNQRLLEESIDQGHGGAAPGLECRPALSHRSLRRRHSPARHPRFSDEPSLERGDTRALRAPRRPKIGEPHRELETRLEEPRECFSWRRGCGAVPGHGGFASTRVESARVRPSARHPCGHDCRRGCRGDR